MRSSFIVAIHLWLLTLCYLFLLLWYIILSCCNKIPWNICPLHMSSVLKKYLGPNYRLANKIWWITRRMNKSFIRKPSHRENIRLWDLTWGICYSPWIFEVWNLSSSENEHLGIRILISISQKFNIYSYLVYMFISS